MLKEIQEQPAAVADTLRGHLVEGRVVLDEQRLTDQDLRDIDKVFVVACGTAYHAGLLAKYAIEHWTRLPVEVELASEFRYRDPVLDRAGRSWCRSASRGRRCRHPGWPSGTPRTEQGARTVLAICNTNGAHDPAGVRCGALHLRAGPEVCVASTKTFLAQLVACVSAGPVRWHRQRGTKFDDEVARHGRPAWPRCRITVSRAARETWTSTRARSPGSSPSSRRGALPRPPRGVPRGHGGCAEAEGARLHARRGLRGRRAQARPDRPDRGPGLPVVVVVPPPTRPVQPALARSFQQHPGGPAPAEPAPSSSPRTGDDWRSCPYADDVIRDPGPVRPCSLRLVTDRAPAGVRGREIAAARGPRRGPAPEPGQVRHRRVIGW